MSKRKAPPWTSQEIAILREHYPDGGLDGVADLLPERSWTAIYVMANKLGLRTAVVADAPEPRLRGAALEEAIRLREEQGWSFARIGAHFGVAEASACNAVLIALCPRKGYRPAERDAHGRLTPAGLERVRYALKKGLKGVDIQLRLGVSASCVAEQRRRYNRELRARGKAELPLPGNGEAYSGVKLTRERIARVEALFLSGLGTLKVSERSGVSKTSCTRIRNRLIRRLKRKGQVLPGSDASGARHVQAESARKIAPEQREQLVALLRDRVPVRRAAAMLAIGTCSAYRMRDALRAELAAGGEELPPPILPGRVRSTRPDPYWPPTGNKEIFAFRAMLATMSLDKAKAEWRRSRAEADRAERQRPKSFAEQLQLVEAGKVRLVQAQPRAHMQPHVAPGIAA